jgi:hypothetical protein
LNPAAKLPDANELVDNRPARIRDAQHRHFHGAIWLASLKNPRSGIRLKVPLEFVIRCPADTTAADYVLLQLFTRRDRREFRTLDGGKSAMRQGPERMTVPFEARRLAPNVYHVTILAVPTGEYGFVAPGSLLKGSAAVSSVTHTFRRVILPR